MPEESQNVVPLMSTMTRPWLPSASNTPAVMAAELVRSISSGNVTIKGRQAVSLVKRPPPAS